MPETLVVPVVEKVRLLILSGFANPAVATATLIIGLLILPSPTPVVSGWVTKVVL